MEASVRTRIKINLEGFTDEVANLILDLVGKRDYHRKVIAKNSLIFMGNSILPQINLMLNSNNYELRLLAAKILQQIGAIESIDTLITLLKDEDSSLRWIAAGGLIRIGRPSIKPILKALIKMGSSYYLRWGSHFVLVNLLNDEEKELFKTLILCLSKNNSIGFIAPIEASKALRIYRQMNKNSQGN